ncbi:MAG: hypothetical protein MUD11_14140 [Rhodobacteraceae bacterium]|jgi:hypothetical protein|nr:hypothetical protein [Paracoccaceae bacterium]
MLTVVPDIHADPQRLAASLSVATKTGHVAFLGDFIDAGADPSAQVDEIGVLTEIKGLIDGGKAVGVMGNHELNAILFHRQDSTGQPLRHHTAKNCAQHRSFIDEFGIGSLAARGWTDWFLRALPLWREIEGLRLVHAFWSDSVIETVRDRRPDGFLRAEDLPEIAAESTAFGRAVKLLVSGPEVPLPPGVSFTDFKGHRRHHMRIAWWHGSASTWRDLALSVPDPSSLPDTKIEMGHVNELYPDDAAPVLFGHYKMQPPLHLVHAKAGCIDYPAAPCVYQWRGEGRLLPGNVVPVR